jgi:flagellar basal-body rod protein FlgB
MTTDLTVMDLLVAGMHAEGQRQQLIAHNVANINTDGYRRLDHDFQEVLAKALDKKGGFDPKKLDYESYQPLSTSINTQGSDVNLDHEVGEMVKNSLRHKTYMLMLKKKYQQMDEAVNIR